MPRQRKGARLWLRPARKDATGQVRQAVWIIIDAGKHIATGCLASEAGRAEQRLATYIAEKYQPERQLRDVEEIDVADVLSIYLEDRAFDDPADQKRFDRRIGRLNEFWGGKRLADVKGRTCREYVDHRGGKGGARRDLEDLRAAINHHAKEGLHRGVVRVVLPEKGQARDRWLTREEAARLLWTCWRAREEQTVHRGPDRGQKIATAKRPLRHLARFILIGLYTGTRAGAIAAASPTPEEGRSFVDLERGIFYRLQIGRCATRKRQPPVPIPPRLLSHMRRWARIDPERAKEAGRASPTHFVEWNGKAVASVKTGFATAVRLAKISGKVSPHTLRHTAATWQMQAATPLWQAAGFLGMSVATLEKTYGHHHPDFLSEAAEAYGGAKKKLRGETLVVSLADERERRRAGVA